MVRDDENPISPSLSLLVFFGTQGSPSTTGKRTLDLVSFFFAPSSNLPLWKVIASRLLASRFFFFASMFSYLLRVPRKEDGEGRQNRTGDVSWRGETLNARRKRSSRETWILQRRAEGIHRDVERKGR